MTENELLEIATRSLVILMYVVALVTGIVSVHKSTMWSRRRSGIAIAIASLVWILFYIVVVETGLHEPTKLILWSRAGHYVNAAALIAMAGNIINATKAENGGPHIVLTLEELT